MFTTLAQYFGLGFAMGTLMWAVSFIYLTVRSAMHMAATEV
jgi:uncharacterized membrane protein YciS (DUF1049 family)